MERQLTSDRRQLSEAYHFHIASQINTAVMPLDAPDKNGGINLTNTLQGWRGV